MGLTARAQSVYDLLNGKPGITRIEGQSVRPIAGTSTPSEHSYGNAIDVYGTVDALLFWAKEMDSNRGKYNVKVVCYDPGIGRHFDTCTTKHTDHLHLDFGPHCGGNVPTSGSADELVSRCNSYQNNEAGTFTPGEPSGILAGILQPLETIFNRGALIVVGGILGVVAVVLIVKDTDVGKAAIGAVSTVATGGAGKAAKVAKGLKGK